MKPITLTCQGSRDKFPASVSRNVNLLGKGKHVCLWIGNKRIDYFGCLSGKKLERLALAILKEFGWEITE